MGSKECVKKKVFEKKHLVHLVVVAMDKQQLKIKHAFFLFLVWFAASAAFSRQFGSTAILLLWSWGVTVLYSLSNCLETFANL